MIFTQEQIKHIANLSRLMLNEEDIQRYMKDLNSIVGYIDKLNELKPEDLVDISVNDDLIMPLRDDKVWQGIIASREELLNCSSKNKINHSIAINNIMQ
ncbi:MAG: Asp-tRNA(Asn)/Glu-tRNA(Gln) amidotransferase subunit GatC [Candidatus Gracilibacteria bacterium]|nr:Asp-tRNA(Asn)/Glu-tRNA(Gln) amidotransferase subunit GatC [Candidatus Gracilibacteria bacterium]